MEGGVKVSKVPSCGNVVLYANNDILAHLYTNYCTGAQSDGGREGGNQFVAVAHNNFPDLFT
jgi:hypothetical protein